MVQTIKDVNAQISNVFVLLATNPSLTENVGGQSIQAGEIIVTSVIVAGDLGLPSVDEEDEIEAEKPAAEVTPSGRRKRKETTFAQHSVAQPATSAESPSPPPTKSKRLRKRTVVEYVATKGTVVAPTSTSGTDEELRKAFKAVEQEKELEELEEGPQEKAKMVEEEEEIPAKVIVESIALAQKQQENTRAELTSSELALFEEPEALHCCSDS
ncbi:unnamed protein product [Prunus armeniaca]